MSIRNFKNIRNFIEIYVPRFMTKYKIPGFSIALIQNDEMIYSEGFGARDLENNLPSTPTTLYGIGSCTKSFVAMSIMQLVEKRKIKLNDPIDRYVPFKKGKGRNPITIHHLLTHSSGIPSLGSSTVTLYRSIGEETGIPWGGVNDFYRFINDAGDEIVSEPGNRFFYFNAGYRILGHIIQIISELTFDAYISKNILKPLNMRRTTFSTNHYEKASDRMTPYWKKPDGTLQPTKFPYPNIADNPEFSFNAAAGGLISSVSELTNYLKVNINQGRWGDIQLISLDSAEKMQKLHIERPQQHFGTYGYGYGWNVTEAFFGCKMISHSGSILVSTAHLAFIPKQKIGIAMLSNTTGFPFQTVAQGIFAALIDKSPEKVVPALRIQKRMEILTGTYEIYKGLGRIKIVNREGLLYLEQSTPFSDRCVPLIPEANRLEHYNFYILSDGIKQPVEFVVNSLEKIDLYIERYRYHKVS
jgi:CubicO group peptidase (beta-lactamase class C family)